MSDEFYGFDNEDFAVDDYDDDNYGDCGGCGDCEDCWDEMMQECGMQADGGCNLAGTEYCDFDCRMRELDDEEI
jgi:hypothetical protein